MLAHVVSPASRAAKKRPTRCDPAIRRSFCSAPEPRATPDRSGPATAIVVNDTAYLVDFGPGVVRRASAAATSRGIAALQPTRLQRAFVTHLHSDHTVGYADLIFSPWTLGRRVPLEVYGPRGIKAMTHHLIEAYRVDIDTRTNADGNQRTFPDGYKVNAHEITTGVVYKDEHVTVTAFATKHAMESYGYRFDTPDRSIVISGDTNPTQATIDACRGCDVLDSRSPHERMACRASRSWWCATWNVSTIFGEVPHDDRTARRTCSAGEAATADPVSLQQSVARRIAGGHDEALFRTIRHRSGS